MGTMITTMDVDIETVRRKVAWQLSEEAKRSRNAHEAALVKRGHALTVRLEMLQRYIDLGAYRLPLYQAYDCATDAPLPFWPNGCPFPESMRGTIRTRLPLARLVAA